jgi:hypothetical protein
MSVLPVVIAKAQPVRYRTGEAEDSYGHGHGPSSPEHGADSLQRERVGQLRNLIRSFCHRILLCPNCCFAWPKSPRDQPPKTMPGLRRTAACKKTGRRSDLDVALPSPSAALVLLPSWLLVDGVRRQCKSSSWCTYISRNSENSRPTPRCTMQAAICHVAYPCHERNSCTILLERPTLARIPSFAILKTGIGPSTCKAIKHKAEDSTALTPGPTPLNNTPTHSHSAIFTQRNNMLHAKPWRSHAATHHASAARPSVTNRRTTK